jgi:hypothetical protein
MTVAGTNYRQRGKPERVMTEIRREILQKISARLKKERRLTFRRKIQTFGRV